MQGHPAVGCRRRARSQARTTRVKLRTQKRVKRTLRTQDDEHRTLYFPFCMLILSFSSSLLRTRLGQVVALRRSLYIKREFISASEVGFVDGLYLLRVVRELRFGHARRVHGSCVVRGITGAPHVGTDLVRHPVVPLPLRQRGGIHGFPSPDPLLLALLGGVRGGSLRRRLRLGLLTLEICQFLGIVLPHPHCCPFVLLVEQFGLLLVNGAVEPCCTCNVHGNRVSTRNAGSTLAKE
mmetsp:Transcript_6750/g.29714  ORF Transcript_6750/g.29714 Transcript_6750/m.29714 type:complete len:237 (+) Transcript_6750:3031-3741(+)